MDYPKANLDEAVTNTLHEELLGVTKEDNKTIVAYKGAVSTLKAKFAKGFKNKKTFFKEGAELLEFAISSEPKNIEIRCLRLGVQENSPRIVGYKNNIEADKQFLLDHYKSDANKEIRNFVKGYVLLSNVFTEAEKQLF
ncbi:hypothetical protein FEE95_03625 [Maribacter algarum]|uniref:Uncharacterized protein n=1 Tax=Maribacter algarum (ex Zhang et al. 2020) TaxID=2578118 RepID=A0A5S3PU86_9FLAO|nr:hypothetical protein [Maribacter algarum]TMM58533.1 hypothetical protein FEE95_03625 [Maribacter algarum]